MVSHNDNNPGNSGLCRLAAVVLLAMVARVDPLWEAAILAGCLLLVVWKLE
ncbi:MULTISPECIES: hypothetical protein [unclassified Bifidobacterium]|uniref:hypothetical protein n=1 Tax=unclassified Bifidobacterium TaxID=2608897 RepID=UPI0023F82EB3|nr:MULTISPECIES: hypothetical protein [unclassified Bifidobacterium]WEV65416.1 hypothetical protein OZX71_06540 [Bifidobacterium sp. ESL0764]WEV75780.1 hypothetical protein OZX75_00780 [Bifidobacterium sp. ESL0800]